MFYEHHTEPLLPWRQFVDRMVRHGFVVVLLATFSLAVGAVGYHLTAGLPWIDATLNAAMILTGMGPVTPLETAPAKLFATAYALYSGIVFLIAAGIALAPVTHRVLHRLHLEDDEREM